MDLKTLYFFTWIRVYYYNNRFILNIKRKRKSKSGNMILVLSLPYILIRYLFGVAIEKMRISYIRKKNISERKEDFEHEIAIVAIAKNEGPYIREWIEYHRLLGVTKFYFYDNESEDQTKEILKPYIQSNLVSYFFIKGKAKQLDAYNDAIERFKYTCQYMAFIDLDEYLMPTVPYQPIVKIVDEAINKYGKGASGIGVNWAIYGSSGHDKAPKGLITQVFNHRGNNRAVGNAHIKTICNPRRVIDYISPHYPLYQLGAYSVSETGDERLYVWFRDKREYVNIRINHYYTKSREQFLNKIARGLGDRVGEYKVEQFAKYDLNEIEDNSMNIYSEKLNETLNNDNFLTPLGH